MGERRVRVVLEASGGETVRRDGVFTEFTVARRAARSGLIVLVSVGLALLFVPIPIIHLLAIPMILLGGIAVAIRQLSVLGRLGPLRIACPKCSALNRIGGGLGVRSMGPRTQSCESCRRELVVRLEPPG